MFLSIKRRGEAFIARDGRAAGESRVWLDRFNSHYGREIEARFFNMKIYVSVLRRRDTNSEIQSGSVE